MDFSSQYQLKRVINAGGTETVLGAAPVGPEVREAMEQVLSLSIVMEDLQRQASRVISRVTGAEAGFIAACADAGIVAGLAGCMTGDDMGRIEQLPQLDGLRDEVIIQRGHVTDAGGMTTLQLARMTGANLVEVGLARVCRGYQLEAAISERTAAILFVMDQEIPGTALLPLPVVSEIAHHHDVPVVVDGANIYGLARPLEQGADLVAVSGHKMLEGPTSGIVYGRKDLVRAAFFQERGIARPMKVGKESVAGAMRALELYAQRDHERYRQDQVRRVRAMIARLEDVPGIDVDEVQSRHSRYMVRARVTLDRQRTGLSEAALATELAAREPVIKALDWLVHGGNLEFDLRYVSDEHVDTICDRIAGIVSNARPDVAAGSIEPLAAQWRQVPYGDWPD